jgi:hypothetical protein
MSGELHTPAALPPGKGPPRHHLIEGWVDPRADMNNMGKLRILYPTVTRTLARNQSLYRPR